MTSLHRRFSPSRSNLTADVSALQILTKDSVTVYVNAIMYYKV